MKLTQFNRWAFLPLLLLVGVPNAYADTVRLVDAVKNADSPTIRRLLRDRVDVNASEPDGTTALDWAVRRNDVETVEMLLRAGANVKAANRYTVTPLTLACTNGNAPIVDMLLKAGADANTVLANGETVLMTASRSGSLDAVKALLLHGADPNVKEKSKGQTALMWAADEGHTDVVKTLLEAGADVHARSTAGFTAMLFAARDGRMGPARALLAAGVDVKEALPAPAGRRRPGAAAANAAAPSSGLDAMLLAAANAHYELAVMLLDAGANANAAPLGWTALHQITGVRKVGLYGSNDPAPEGSGNVTSLEFVRKLVAHGADVNARATRRPNLGITQMNAVGATPFLLACRTADVELMKLLVELGANPLLTNADNSTPLMVAAGIGTASPPEDPGTEAEVVEAVKLAIKLGGDPNAVDKNGETAMHGAAYKQMPGAALALAENGAKVDVWNQKNKKGWTPLKISEGVHIGMNIQSSMATAAAIRSAMVAAGVAPVVPEGSSIEPATAVVPNAEP